MANVYEVIHDITQRTKTAMIEDVRTQIGDKAHADIAADYIDTTAEKISEEVRRYLRAYNDFKN